MTNNEDHLPVAAIVLLGPLLVLAILWEHAFAIATVLVLGVVVVGSLSAGALEPTIGIAGAAIFGGILYLIHRRGVRKDLAALERQFPGFPH